MPEREEIINYIKRAFELKAQECYKQAIEMLYKALAIEPDNIEILFQTGELYFLLQNYARAIRYPEQILTMNGNHLPSLNLLKEIYIRQNKLLPAKDIAEKIYLISPTSENLLTIIKLYGRLGLTEEIDMYSDKIENDDRCLFEYANACCQNGKTEKADELIKKALLINPENDDCLILLGKILFDKKEFNKAKEVFEKFGKNSQNPEVLNYQGLLALEETNFIDAIKDFSKASNLDKKNPLYFYNLANAYFLNGWAEEAISAYKNAICMAPDNLDYRYSLAYLYFEYKDFDKAKRETDIILEHNGKYYPARVLRALLLHKNKNYLEAEKLLLSNITEGNSDDYTLSSLSKIELDLGKFDKAEEYLKAVLKRNPESLTYKCDLGDIFIKSKKYDKTLNLAREILKENANYLYGYILGAKAAFLKGDMETAKGFAQKALALDINCAEGYYCLALVRIEEKDYEEAVECMKRAITHDLTNAGYYAKMAEIYKLSGDIKTAFDYVKEAESIDDSEEYKILYREFATLNRK